MGSLAAAIGEPFTLTATKKRIDLDQSPGEMPCSPASNHYFLRRQTMSSVEKSSEFAIPSRGSRNKRSWTGKLFPDTSPARSCPEDELLSSRTSSFKVSFRTQRDKGLKTSPAHVAHRQLLKSNTTAIVLECGAESPQEAPAHRKSLSCHIPPNEEHDAPISPLKLVSHTQLLRTIEDASECAFTDANEVEMLLLGQRNASNFHIIDCRYPFEYNGGHIKGAINLYEPKAVEDFFEEEVGPNPDANTVIVFHCEFSQCRAPRLFKHVRSLDRRRHLANYPELSYPNMYVLLGGYKEFFKTHSHLCDPREYVAMEAPAFAEEMERHTKEQNRIWNAKREGGQAALRRSGGSGRSRLKPGAGKGRKVAEEREEKENRDPIDP
eukprot:jgi/Mesvir1/22505/Mv18536-RA.1